MREGIEGVLGNMWLVSKLFNWLKILNGVDWYMEKCIIFINKFEILDIMEVNIRGIEYIGMIEVF